MNDSSQLKVMVVGGAGYIGSHAVHALIQMGIRVVVVDNYRESRNNIKASEMVSYHEVDIRKKDDILALMKDVAPEIVFHFAALASVPDSMSRPYEYYENNILGGLNLLEAMRFCGVKKIVFSSSASVYGEPQGEEIQETHPKNPTNTYGYTKLVFEHILNDYHRAYGFDSVSLRYFCASGCNVEAGLGEYHSPETHVIPSIVETLLGVRDEFYVYGDDFTTHDGTGVRDYIHVDDLASAHICAMKKLLEGRSVCLAYNLGINKGFSVMDLIKVAEEVSGKTLRYSVRNRRPGDPSRLIADASRANEELGWKPIHTNVRDMVESTYVSFENRNKNK